MNVLQLILFFCILNRLADAGRVLNNRDRSSVNPLKGKHLRVMWPNWRGNPKGLTGPTKGQLIVDYLAARFHFTYQFVRVTENWLEPINGTIKGQLSYLWNDEIDMLISLIVPLYGRHNVIDLSSGFAYDISLLIPVSNQAFSNTQAVVKPFQWPVWLLLALSIVSVTYVFKQIQTFLFTTESIPNNERANIRLTHPYLYVSGNILSQGGSYTVNRLPIRLIAGTWCLAAFVLVSAYNSTLITYVLAPTNRPLVNSFRELIDRPDVTLWMRKSGTTYHLLHSTEIPTEFLKKMRSKVASSPESRCTLASECVSQVKPETKNVYVGEANNMKSYIKDRFIETGKCEVQIMGNDLLTITTSIGLQKNSPYTSSISKGVTELRENGLYDFWDVLMRAYPPQCWAAVHGLAEKQEKTDGPQRLSLKNLTGAFVVFSVGLGVSLLVFLCELIYSSFQKAFCD